MFDLGEFEREMNRYANYCRKHEIKRTLEGHLRGIRNWFKKAREFKGERDAGLVAAFSGGVQVPGHIPDDSNLGGVAGLAPKLTAYRKFLAANPRLAEEYLARQPARVQQAIREAGHGEV
jgi:hypothetical protein